MKTLVIVPTYNERENLPRLIEAVLATTPEVEMLIVDDNSPDGTGGLADEIAAKNPRVHVMHRPGKLGLGTAYIAGFRWALERDYEAVMEMDADFSHDPRELPAFLAAAKDADVVIGSRYKQGVRVVDWPLRRLLLSYGASRYVRLITGMPIHDPTGGFKLFRRHVLAALNLEQVHSEGYSFQIEMNYRCWMAGFRLVEIPITFVDRRVGVSKISRRIVWEALWVVWRLAAAHGFRRRTKPRPAA
ncbi:MAG: polyprenol monophosphomannose synthase [Verrucomicrobiae bacterium]|nr:polyprenol monophosphomannose synthase [Verrucomicrobiae bacterium]